MIRSIEVEMPEKALVMGVVVVYAEKLESRDGKVLVALHGSFMLTNNAPIEHINSIRQAAQLACAE